MVVPTNAATLAPDPLVVGSALERAGRPRDALSLYAAALVVVPGQAALHEAAARAAIAVRDYAAAATHAEHGLAIDPARDPLRGHLAVALLESGRLVEAEAAATELTARRPGDAGSLNLLGVIQKRQGRIEAAIATLTTATMVAPNDHSSWYNLGNSRLAAGDGAEAVEPLRRALDLKVDSSETARLLGQALAATKCFGQAYAAFDRAERLDPANQRVFTSRALALQAADAPDGAVLAQFDCAIGLAPASLDHRRAKAVYLQRRNRFDDAVAANREILASDPDDIETLLRIGHVLGYSLRRYEEANDYLRRALDLRPDDPRCLSGLCKSLLDSRYGVESDHVEEAGQVARRLLASTNDVRPLAANLMGVFLRLADFDGMAALGDRTELMRFWVDRMNVGSLHNQLGRVETSDDRHALVHWHREWGNKVAAAVAKITPPLARASRRRGANGKIRVGFMSSDLRNHPVAYFALPIFEQFDAARFELFVYSFYPADADTVQAFVQKRATIHRSMLEATDLEIAQRIAADDLDILFELGGSTRYNRLDVMAYRPAPIQVSWLGYPHSCGLGAIDYILVDPYLQPDDPALLIERPFVVPESWVVLGKLGFRDIPIEPGIPADAAGAITFGTMNNPYKYTRSTFALWAAVMNRVPGSRFLFVRPEAGAASFRANIAREFGEHGIDATRILFESVRGRHLPHYNRIDIALDTAPQTGGTTTCETLWMGVPTVTLVGPAFFERLSYSNLTNAGLGDLCAFTREDYVEIALKLAADEPRRRELRHGLRAQIRSLPLGDEVRWVRNFEAAIVTAVEAREQATG